MYKNNELIITCKVCGKEKKVRNKRDIHRGGNYCSQKCYQKWVKENLSISKEDKRKRWNQYCLKYYYRSEKYLAIQIRQLARKQQKEELRLQIQQRKIERHQKSIEKKKIREKYYQLIGLRTLWDRRKREKHKAILKKYKRIHDTYPPEFLEKKRRQRKRYKLRHPGSSKGIKVKAFRKLCAKQNYCCVICGHQEPFSDQYWPWLTQDHIIPRSKNGRKRSITNIQPLCWNCNSKKSDKIL